jgi:uncharacterized OB-fold protein
VKPKQPAIEGWFTLEDEAPHLIGTRCTACGSYFFPARADCPHCGEGGRIENRAVSGTGTIYASTVVHVPSPAGLRPPYAIGYVHLDAAPLRVFALFTSVDPRELVPGARVDMVIEPLRVSADGTPLVSHRFRPTAVGARP